MRYRNKSYAAGDGAGRSATHRWCQGRVFATFTTPLVMGRANNKSRKDTLSVSNYLPVTHGTPILGSTSGGAR